MSPSAQYLVDAVTSAGGSLAVATLLANMPPEHKRNFVRAKLETRKAGVLNWAPEYTPEDGVSHNVKLIVGE